LLDTHLAGGGVCMAASHQALPIAAKRARSLALRGAMSGYAS
jgi:ABC-type transport system involved in cytochrome c biogenesis ATPase subunit